MSPKLISVFGHIVHSSVCHSSKCNLFVLNCFYITLKLSCLFQESAPRSHTMSNKDLFAKIICLRILLWCFYRKMPNYRSDFSEYTTGKKTIIFFIKVGWSNLKLLVSSWEKCEIRRFVSSSYCSKLIIRELNLNHFQSINSLTF